MELPNNIPKGMSLQMSLEWIERNLRTHIYHARTQTIIASLIRGGPTEIMKDYHSTQCVHVPSLPAWLLGYCTAEHFSLQSIGYLVLLNSSKLSLKLFQSLTNEEVSPRP